MHRRYFEHLYGEICVALSRRVSRYDLWLLVWNSGGDPDELDAGQARRFVENDLRAFLVEENARLGPRALRRLERRILGFDPRHPTPEECFSRFGAMDREAT
jgi:hypothetical protein